MGGQAQDERREGLNFPTETPSLEVNRPANASDTLHPATNDRMLESVLSKWGSGKTLTKRTAV